MLCYYVMWIPKLVGIWWLYEIIDLSLDSVFFVSIGFSFLILRFNSGRRSLFLLAAISLCFLLRLPLIFIAFRCFDYCKMTERSVFHF